MAARRLTKDDLNIPEYAEDVPKGYPVHAYAEEAWRMVATIYGPIMASPRPRVTSRGTFMPTDYRKHCDAVAASLAFARGAWESEYGTPWDPSRNFEVTMAFNSHKLRGDLDNLAKTIMDAGQLHKNEPSGAEIWSNDRQIIKLSLSWVETDAPEWEFTTIRVRAR